MRHTAGRATPFADVAEWNRLHCSFCGKDAGHVRFLAAGIAGGRICDACCYKAFFVFMKAWLTPRRAR